MGIREELLTLNKERAEAASRKHLVGSLARDANARSILKVDSAEWHCALGAIQAPGSQPVCPQEANFLPPLQPRFLGSSQSLSEMIPHCPLVSMSRSYMSSTAYNYVQQSLTEDFSCQILGMLRRTRRTPCSPILYGPCREKHA